MEQQQFQFVEGFRAALVIILALCWQIPDVAWSQTVETDTATIERGKNLVEKNCSQCHATDKADISKHPASIAFRELSTRYPVGLLAEALAEGILTGHPDMPAFGFYPNEIAQIVSYIETIQNE